MTTAGTACGRRERTGDQRSGHDLFDRFGQARDWLMYGQVSCGAWSEPFAVFAQWVEILPTDQVVAVEVAYDPKTGLQL